MLLVKLVPAALLSKHEFCRCCSLLQNWLFSPHTSNLHQLPLPKWRRKVSHFQGKGAVLCSYNPDPRGHTLADWVQGIQVTLCTCAHDDAKVLCWASFKTIAWVYGLERTTQVIKPSGSWKYLSCHFVHHFPEWLIPVNLHGVAQRGLRWKWNILIGMSPDFSPFKRFYKRKHSTGIS